MGTTHHQGISVFGSGLGLQVGIKGLETPLFPSGLLRVDAGTTSVPASGYVTGWSTRLSSIIWATAAPNYSTSAMMAVKVNWSGGALDFYPISSSGTVGGSGSINFMAIG
jgi:hypothetical protein